jgi:hypothetical protein
MAKIEGRAISGASHRNMGNWKLRKIKKKGRGSQTTGRTKGIVASPLQKFMCRHGRSYKHPLYGDVMESLGQRKRKGGAAV